MPLRRTTGILFDMHLTDNTINEMKNDKKHDAELDKYPPALIQGSSSGRLV